MATLRGLAVGCLLSLPLPPPTQMYAQSTRLPIPAQYVHNVPIHRPLALFRASRGELVAADWAAAVSRVLKLEDESRAWRYD